MSIHSWLRATPAARIGTAKAAGAVGQAVSELGQHQAGELPGFAGQGRKRERCPKKLEPYLFALALLCLDVANRQHLLLALVEVLQLAPGTLVQLQRSGLRRAA